MSEGYEKWLPLLEVLFPSRIFSEEERKKLASIPLPEGPEGKMGMRGPPGMMGRDGMDGRDGFDAPPTDPELIRRIYRLEKVVIQQHLETKLPNVLVTETCKFL